MAHTVHSDSSGSYVVVVRGDTLSGIAYEFRNSYDKKSWQQLATLNSLANANLIYPNQKIYLTKSSSGSSSSSATKDPNISAIGVQSTDDGTLFATWTWSRHNDTEKYETKWEYDLGDKSGSNILWYVDKGSTEERYSTWSIKTGARSVRFSIKPISKKKDDGKSTYFEETWSSTVSWTNNLPLPTPSNLTVDMDGCTLTAKLSGLETSCPGATHIAFEVVKNNNTVVYKAETCTTTIQTGHASYSWTVDPGAEYKVRCYAYTSENKSGQRSEWTAYSDNYPSTPASVAGFKTIKAVDKTSVYLEWVASATAKSYDIEWYDDKTNIGLTDPTGSDSIEKQTACKITDLLSGDEYFFRIRAKNEEGESDWSQAQSIIVGTAPSEPTTWSTPTTTVVAGEDLVLYWVHNSEDESSQSTAELQLDITVDGESTTQTYTVINSTDDELKDKTSSCVINTETGYISWVEDDGVHQFYLGVQFKENVQIKWQVKTRGIAAEYSKFSEPRMVDVYSRPELTLSMGGVEYHLVEKVNDVYTKTTEVVDTSAGSALASVFTTTGEQVYQYVNSSGETAYYCYEIADLGLDDTSVSDIPIVKSFPFYILAVPGPKTQTPIGYHLSISANTAYETTDSIGNVKMVNAGEQVYSKYFDIKHDLLVEFSPGNIDLENNINYTITCTVSMDSGLTAEVSKPFTVGWVDQLFSPNAEVGIYSDVYSATIRPYCEDRKISYRKVERNNRVYTVTDTAYEFVYGEPVKKVVTTTGEQVYKGVTADGEEIYFCEFSVVTPVTDVYLAVYRREFDGSFTKLATMLDAANNTAITDPHPALDYARYRIVATSKSTGAVSYRDLPGVLVNGKSVIIQWSEAWTTFESLEENRSAEPTWSGSMLSLPYNIDVSDNTDPEVELVGYIGRKHPVAYYGTQRGQKSTWNVVIPKDDEETLYGLRRLAMWMDDVYVREPSGSGYWANVKISFSQKYNDLTIPVTLNITRVEGGM